MASDCGILGQCKIDFLKQNLNVVFSRESFMCLAPVFMSRL